MRPRRIYVAVCSLLNLAFVSCGGTAIAPKAPDYSTIEGNWHLTGQAPFTANLSQAPVLTLAIGRSGNTLYATGDAIVACPQSATWMGGPISGVGAPATAETGADGTFLFTNASDPLSPIQFTIRGAAGPTGSSTWKGTYTIFNAPSSLLHCDFHQSGEFTATAFPPLHGTFKGTITGPGFDSGASVDLQIAQGEPTVVPGGQTLASGLTSTTTFYIPLSGTIRIGGSPCFTTGAFTSDGQSEIAGDRVRVLATMNDGTAVSLIGWLSDQSAVTLTQVQLQVLGRGSCSGAFGNGSLTVQP
jgi:hypothetical protein